LTEQAQKKRKRNWWPNPRILK